MYASVRSCLEKRIPEQRRLIGIRLSASPQKIPPLTHAIRSIARQAPSPASFLDSNIDKKNFLSEARASAASAPCLAPLNLRRRISRRVSCYALFKGWLLLSQPPRCLRNSTSFTTEHGFRGLSRRSGLFPSCTTELSPRLLTPGVVNPAPIFGLLIKSRKRNKILSAIRVVSAHVLYSAYLGQCP